MTWLFEQPLAIVALGVALLVAVGVAWSATGRKELLYGLGVVLALLVAALVVEQLVVTDREAIRATLQQIARDVQSNNHRALRRHIHSAAAELRQKADAELPRYRFTECRVTRIHRLDVNGQAQPRQAVVEFNVIASGSFRVDSFEFDDTIPRWVRLHLVREPDGRWTVTDYEHDDPQRFMMRQP
jgi:uncharacterized transporter YbjL